MPYTVVSPDSVESPIDAVSKAIAALEAQGGRVIQVQEVPQAMPNQSSYLIITEGDGIERR